MHKRVAFLGDFPGYRANNNVSVDSCFEYLANNNNDVLSW